MRASPWSIGVVMILFGAAALGLGPITWSAITLAVALGIGGGALFLRRPAMFWVALAGGLVAMAFGVAGLILRRPLGLPLPPIAGLLVGLYVCFRVVVARRGLMPRPPRDDEEEDEGEGEAPPAKGSSDGGGG